MTAPATADFVGLAVTIYNRSLTTGQQLQINNTQYTVLDVSNDTWNGYYGAVLLNQQTNTLFVVNRGTEPTSWKDWATDADMATTDANVQWQDADKLAQFVAKYAKTTGDTVYTTQ